MSSPFNAQEFKGILKIVFTSFLEPRILPTIPIDAPTPGNVYANMWQQENSVSMHLDID